jgi:hypothetical protein
MVKAKRNLTIRNRRPKFPPGKHIATMNWKAFTAAAAINIPAFRTHPNEARFSSL